LNLALIVVTSIIFVFVRGDSLGITSKWSIMITIVGVGAVLVVIALLSVAILQLTYDVRLEQAKKELSKTVSNSVR